MDRRNFFKALGIAVISPKIITKIAETVEPIEYVKYTEIFNLRTGKLVGETFKVMNTASPCPEMSQIIKDKLNNAYPISQTQIITRKQMELNKLMEHAINYGHSPLVKELIK